MSIQRLVEGSTPPPPSAPPTVSSKGMHPRQIRGSKLIRRGAEGALQNYEVRKTEHELSAAASSAFEVARSAFSVVVLVPQQSCLVVAVPFVASVVQFRRRQH